jgi:excisionase family DNA binding protein
MNEKLTLSVEEAGKLLGVSRQVAYQLIHRSDFPTLHIGRRILVPKKQLEIWMDRNVTGTEADFGQAG